MSALLEAGAPADATGQKGETALHLACLSPSAPSVQALFAAGASPHLAESQGLTPLHLAASTGHALAVEALLSAGARRDARDRRGWTPVQMAQRSCSRPATVGGYGAAIKARERAHRPESHREPRGQRCRRDRRGQRASTARTMLGPAAFPVIIVHTAVRP
mgnify:FL=1